MEANISELYQREKPVQTKRKSTRVVVDFDPSKIRTVTPEEQQARLKALESMPDEDIDFSNIPDISEERMNNAVFIRNPWVVPPTKTTLKEVQIDSDIIFWIIRQVGEKGYQEKMNAMLRQAMEIEREKNRQETVPA